MIGPLNKKQRSALVWACANWDALKEERETLARGSVAGLWQANTYERQRALEALSNPTEAARLIKTLVEMAGVEVLEATKSTPLRDSPDFDSVTLTINDIPGNPLMLVMPLQEARASIARLLALPPNAGAETVLEALRGAK